MAKITQLIVEAIVAKTTDKIGATLIAYLPAIDSPMRARMETCELFYQGVRVGCWDYQNHKFHLDLCAPDLMPADVTDVLQGLERRYKSPTPSEAA